MDCSNIISLYPAGGVCEKSRKLQSRIDPSSTAIDIKGAAKYTLTYNIIFNMLPKQLHRYWEEKALTIENWIDGAANSHDRTA